MPTRSWQSASTSPRSSGFAAAGFVVCYLSTRTAFTVDAATFGVSAVTLLAMTVWPTSRHEGGRQRRGWRAPDPASGRDPRGRPLPARARRAAREHRPCHRGGGGSRRLLSPHFSARGRQVRRRAAFGFMEASLAVGYFCASVVIGCDRDKRVRKGLAITLGLMVMGVCCPALGDPRPAPRPRSTSSCMGAANAAVLISIDTYVQATVPPKACADASGAPVSRSPRARSPSASSWQARSSPGSGSDPLFGLCGAVSVRARADRPLPAGRARRLTPDTRPCGPSAARPAASREAA